MLPMGAGTDVAIASAGVILASDDLRSVLSVPLAAGVLAGIGFVMPMSAGALLMSLSTVVVALNAQLLRRLDLRPGK
ncbi:hypothetical protein GCM10028784_39530 [Myceligenerans cantabricum]